jgi:hypothetical protein
MYPSCSTPYFLANDDAVCCFSISILMKVRIAVFLTLPIVWYSEKLENTMFQKLDVFLSSGEGQTRTLLGPLEGANLNHWTTYVGITTAI